MNAEYARALLERTVAANDRFDELREVALLDRFEQRHDMLISARKGFRRRLNGAFMHAVGRDEIPAHKKHRSAIAFSKFDREFVFNGPPEIRPEGLESKVNRGNFKP